VSEPFWLDLHDVCAIHGELIAESGGAAGVLLEGAIESTLHKAKNLYYYSDRKATLYQLAATYGYGFAKNHCFVDGNKRVALIVVYTFLAINGIELTASEVDAASCFLDLAASMETQEECLQKLSEWLQENSEQIPAQE
jgi:death on curing protein